MGIIYTYVGRTPEPQLANSDTTEKAQRNRKSKQLTKKNNLKFFSQFSIYLLNNVVGAATYKYSNVYVLLYYYY